MATEKTGIVMLGKGGGSGVLSDDLTATKEFVKEGLTYLGKDTDDDAGKGTLPIIDKGTIALTINGIYEIPHGWHPGTEKVTQSITVDKGGSYKPLLTDRIVGWAGTYLENPIIIEGGGKDFNSSNIAPGVKIFNVTGDSRNVSKFTLSAYSVFSYQGSTMTITISDIVGTNTWEVTNSNNEVCTVAKNSNEIKVTGVGTGNSTITIKELGNETYSDALAYISVQGTRLSSERDIYYKGAYREGWHLAYASYDAGDSGSYLWVDRLRTHDYSYSSLRLQGPRINTNRVYCNISYTWSPNSSSSDIYSFYMSATGNTPSSKGFGWAYPGGEKWPNETYKSDTVNGVYTENILIRPGLWSTGGVADDDFLACGVFRVDHIWCL